MDETPGLGLRWEGVGAISGGGATSKLLMDYSKEDVSDILDFMFTPGVGLDLDILKVPLFLLFLQTCTLTTKMYASSSPHRLSLPFLVRSRWAVIRTQRKVQSHRTCTAVLRMPTTSADMSIGS